MPEEVLNQLVVVVVSFGWGGVGQLAAAFAAVLLLGLRRKYCGSSQVHLTKSYISFSSVVHTNTLGSKNRQLPHSTQCFQFHYLYILINR